MRGAAVVALDAAGGGAGDGQHGLELLGRGRRRHAHRAELQDVELLAVAADAALAVEDRAGRGELARRAASAPNSGAAASSSRPAKTRSKRVLDGELPRLGVDAVQADERQAADVLDPLAAADVLEQARDDRDLEAELVALAQQRLHGAVGRVGEGDDHVLGAGAADRPGEVGGRAEDRGDGRRRRR